MIIRTGLRNEAAQRDSTNSQLQNVTEVSLRYVALTRSCNFNSQGNIYINKCLKTGFLSKFFPIGKVVLVYVDASAFSSTTNTFHCKSRGVKKHSARIVLYHQNRRPPPTDTESYMCLMSIRLERLSYALEQR